MLADETWTQSNTKQEGEILTNNNKQRERKDEIIENSREEVGGKHIKIVSSRNGTKNEGIIYQENP